MSDYQASGPETIDLLFLGRPHAVGTAVLRGTNGVALVDPGPASTLPVLERGLAALGIAMDDVRALLLTHIHLDHAGATGTIVGRHPHVAVHVHERGAPHLIDPSKLIRSATRLYQQDMAQWGEILPVPAANVHALGERVDLTVAGRTFDVRWAPGHASHHVVYFEPATGVAYVGDNAGIRRPGSAEVVPPTPPPDIDLEAWRVTTDRILAFEPRALFLTHFGLFDQPEPHLRKLWRAIDDWRARVKASLDEPGTDEERAARFAKEAFADLARETTPDEAAATELAGRFDYSWQGLARYLRGAASRS
jgi:glyoxylase-like metal-dependent hydrolase (beta-lactamase superfamily II)